MTRYNSPSKRRRSGYNAFSPGQDPVSTDPAFLEGWRQAELLYREQAEKDAEKLPILLALNECQTVDDLKDFILEHLL